MYEAEATYQLPSLYVLRVHKNATARPGSGEPPVGGGTAGGGWAAGRGGTAGGGRGGRDLASRRSGAGRPGSSEPPTRGGVAGGGRAAGLGGVAGELMSHVALRPDGAAPRICAEGTGSIGSVRAWVRDHIYFCDALPSVLDPALGKLWFFLFFLVPYLFWNL